MTNTALTENLSTHRYATGSLPTSEMALLASIILASSGHLLIKAGLNGAGPVQSHAGLAQQFWHFLSQPAVFWGLVVYGTGTLMWAFALSKTEVSYLFPMTSLNYVLVTLGGKFLFGEVVPLGRWMGILVVVLGVVLMHRSVARQTE